MKSATTTAFCVAGLFIAGAAWAMHQQTNYTIASLACRHEGVTAMWGVTGASVVLIIAAAFASWLSRPASASTTDDAGRPRRFLAQLSFAAAALFLFAIVLQAAATLFLPNCLG